jgi:hypothetical protein
MIGGLANVVTHSPVLTPSIIIITGSSTTERAALRREKAVRVEARRLAMIAVKNEIRSAGLRKLGSYGRGELTRLAIAQVDAEQIDAARERVSRWFGDR